jgi:hypothetical protein
LLSSSAYAIRPREEVIGFRVPIYEPGFNGPELIEGRAELVTHATDHVAAVPVAVTVAYAGNFKLDDPYGFKAVLL